MVNPSRYLRASAGESIFLELRQRAMEQQSELSESNISEVVPKFRAPSQLGSELNLF